MQPRRVPLVWLDPERGSQHCSCGWVRPATSDLRQDLDRATEHANECTMHVGHLVACLDDAQLALGIPEYVVRLLRQVIASPTVRGRELVGRWLSDLEDGGCDYG